MNEMLHKYVEIEDQLHTYLSWWPHSPFSQVKSPGFLFDLLNNLIFARPLQQAERYEECRYHNW